VNKPDCAASVHGDWWPFGKDRGRAAEGRGRPRMVIFIGCDRCGCMTSHSAMPPAGRFTSSAAKTRSSSPFSIRTPGTSPTTTASTSIIVTTCASPTVTWSAPMTPLRSRTPRTSLLTARPPDHVTGCVLASRSCALKIDEIYTTGTRDIVFADCVVSRSNRGLVIKAAMRRHRERAVRQHHRGDRLLPHNGGAPPNRSTSATFRDPQTKLDASVTSGSVTSFVVAKAGSSCTAGPTAPSRTSSSTKCGWRWPGRALCRVVFTTCARRGVQGHFREQTGGDPRPLCERAVTPSHAGDLGRAFRPGLRRRPRPGGGDPARTRPRLPESRSACSPALARIFPSAQNPNRLERRSVTGFGLANAICRLQAGAPPNDYIIVCSLLLFWKKRFWFAALPRWEISRLEPSRAGNRRQ